MKSPSNCYPRHEEEGAGYYCPAHPYAYPDDEDWDAYCDACREGKARDDELRGDAERDEA